MQGGNIGVMHDGPAANVPLRKLVGDDDKSISCFAGSVGGR